MSFEEFKTLARFIETSSIAISESQQADIRWILKLKQFEMLLLLNSLQHHVNFACLAAYERYRIFIEETKNISTGGKS